MRKKTFKLMKKQFGVPLLVLLVLFSHLTAVETKRKETTATSHKHKWMDMMQATQSQQCHTLQPENRDTEDKLVLAPIVFQGTYILGWVNDRAPQITLACLQTKSHRFQKYP